MVEPTRFTPDNATATAGYYFYSFKQITLVSKTTDSFSLPHIHPHTYTRAWSKNSHHPQTALLSPQGRYKKSTQAECQEDGLSGCA